MDQKPQFRDPFKYGSQHSTSVSGNYNIEMVTPDPSQYQDPSAINTETGPLSRMLPRNGVESVVIPHADASNRSADSMYRGLRMVINPHMPDAVEIDMAHTSPERLSQALGAAQQHGMKYARDILQQPTIPVQPVFQPQAVAPVQYAPAPAPAPAPASLASANNAALLSRLTRQPGARVDAAPAGVVQHPKVAVQYMLPGFGSPIQAFFHDVIHEGLVLALLHDTRYDGPEPMLPPILDVPLHLLVPSLSLDLHVTSLGLQYTASGVLHTILVVGGAE